jgi:hypothetical protein
MSASYVLAPGDRLRVLVPGSDSVLVSLSQQSINAPPRLSRKSGTFDIGPFWAETTVTLEFSEDRGSVSMTTAAGVTTTREFTGASSGGGVVNEAATTTVVLDGRRVYDPLYLAGNTTITVTGDTKGADALMEVIGNGTATLTIVGSAEVNGSFPFEPGSLLRNILRFEHTGFGRIHAFGQPVVNNPVSPAPPAPTPPAPEPPAPTPPAPTPPAPPPSGGEDALTTAYRAAMAAAGQTVNETHVGYADTFAKGLRAAGLHTKATLVNLGIGDTLAAALIPFIGSAAQTAVGTVTFDPALGFSTDGTSGRINAGVIGKAGAFDLWAYNRTAQASDANGRCLIGTSSASDNYRIIGNRTPGVAGGSANGHVSNLMGNTTAPAPYVGLTSGGLTAGMWHSIRRNATNTELVRNGTSLGVSTAAETAPGADTAVNVTVMALNTATNSANSYLAAGSRVSSYGIGDGSMTISEMATFRTLHQAFETSMGRAV